MAATYDLYAYRLWPLLCQCAEEGTTVNYTEAGEQIGLGKRMVGKALSLIQDLVEVPVSLSNNHHAVLTTPGSV